MAEIRVLSQLTADKIAAGEVAERPSSVVKELVENSIDAGADRITVEIRDGGVKLICVTDNGCGIAKDDAQTAFLRHATSKIREIGDLENIGTMGFRGEALASICAVSEVEMITRTESDEEGTYVKMERGKAVSTGEIACNRGTVLSVKNLFMNVPARMKFLKKNSTESGYVADVLGRIALSKPDIAIKYICDDKEIFATSGDGNLINAILKIYGRECAENVIELDYSEDGVRVFGVIGKPEISRGNRTRQTLFVNGRYIKNHVVSKVVEEAYRNMVMVGRFPFFVLNIELSPQLVDVNVHPAKTEIKFANEKKIYDIVYHAVKGRLSSVERRPSAPAKTEAAPFERPEPAGESRPAQFKLNLTPRPDSVSRTAVAGFMKNTVPEAKEESGAPLHGLSDISADKRYVIDDRVKTEGGEDELPFEIVGEYDDYKIVGQIFSTYIVAEKGDSVFFVDQHAAHERINFEKLMSEYSERKVLSQQLLVPVVVDLNQNEMRTLSENSEYFSNLGFVIEEFGVNSAIVRQTPVDLPELSLKQLIYNLIDAVGENRKHAVPNFEEKIVDMVSCKSAIKANRKLSTEEAEILLKRLDTLIERGINTCPHGRPIRVEMTKTDFEKMFKRIT